MADQCSVEMLAFTFASRTFAHKILAQGVSRLVHAFSSFMSEYLEPVVKAGQCAQYVDDIAIAANNATDLTRNLRAVYQCIRHAGLKLTIEKCHFGVKQSEFLGRTISSERVSPQSHKIQNFLSNLRFPKSKKALQRYLRFVKYYGKYVPRMAEKLNPFYKLLKAEVPINITSELKETFDSVHDALNDACQLALKQPIPGKQVAYWRMQAPEARVMPSWLKMIRTRKSNQRGRLTQLSRLDPNCFPPHNSRFQFTRKIFWPSIWNSLSLHTFCGKQQNRRLS